MRQLVRAVDLEGTFMNIELLRQLCETPGVPGHEDRVRDLILKATDWIIWSNYVYMTCKDHEPRPGGATPKC